MPIHPVTALLVVVAAAEGAQWHEDTADFLASTPDAWRTRLVGPPPVVPIGASFSAGFSDHAVLQRGDKARAAIYGMPGTNFTLPATVEVKVSEGGSTKTYTAEVTNTTGLGEWKVLLDPHPAGGNLTITTACTKGCQNTTATTIRDVTYGDVWVCSGQSNMELIAYHTFSRNKSIEAILNGKYHNVRIYQHPHIASHDPLWVQPREESTALSMQWNTALTAASETMVLKQKTWTMLTQFSGLCWYFAQELTDIMEQEKLPTIPIGVIDLAWGGTMIEHWSTNETTAGCRNTSTTVKNGMLYNGMVGPFANTTITGWLWYQGENNIGHGTSDPYFPKQLGYACQMPAMIRLWRETWSREEGTTSPMAPFGLVDLASGQSEGHGGNGAMGNFRWAQTASYGVLPNEAMPNTFMANAYDLGDPWDKKCIGMHCCTLDGAPEATCVAKYRDVWDVTETPFYMGPIHARPKQPVGQRLAQGAYNMHYGGKGALSGPVISGCSVSGSTAVLTFNQSLLKGDTVKVRTYSTEYRASAMQALIGMELPEDGWHTALPNQWEYVNISQASPYEVKVDLSAFSGVKGGLRYAWEDRWGCGDMKRDTQPCPFGEFPIVSAERNLPAMPFILRIADGKCSCVAPQRC